MEENKEKTDTDHINSFALLSPEISLTTMIQEAYEADKTTRIIVDTLKTSSRRQWPAYLRRLLRKDMIEFKLINNLIYFRNRLFVPDYENLRLQVVHRIHPLVRWPSRPRKNFRSIAANLLVA